jgi:DeoR/GlpR family transcriptional regulator of sugar metabolism
MGKIATSMKGLSSRRQDEILLHVKEKGSLTIGQLAQRFAVSEMTVRRVLFKLSAANLIIRIPGGAMAAPSGSMERTFVERTAKMSAAKDAIGRAAAALVNNGETVVLDSGTTTQYIARHLAMHKDLTVVTASLAVLEELARSSGVQVRLTGGVYRRISHDLCGAAVEEALANIHADWAFFGAAALSFNKGAMNNDPDLPKTILQAGKRSVLVIDSSKVGTEAVYRFCPVERCDLVITDNGLKGSDIKKLRNFTKVLVAE